MDVVREHDENVLVVLARDHRVVAVNLSREQRHAFVLHGGTVERDEFEVQEILRLQQLRQNDLSVVSGVGRVVDEGAVVVLETDEASVLDAVALAGRGRKDDALRDRLAFGKAHFVIRLREQPDAARGPVGRGVGCFRVLALCRQDAQQFVHGERIVELLQHAAAKLVLQAQFLKLAREERFVIRRIGHPLRLRGEFHRRRERDAMLRADDADAKRDG